MRIAKLQLAHSADQRASEFLNRDLLAVIKQTATELRLELEISKYKPELLEALRLDILGVGLTHAAAVAQHRASGASPRPRARGRPPDPFMKMLAVDAARKGIPPAVMKRALSEGKSGGVAETKREAFRKAHRAARRQSKLDASWMEGSLTELLGFEVRLAEKRAAKKGGE